MFWYILKVLWPDTTRAARIMDTVAQGTLSRDEMERRRLLAAEELQSGLSQSQVARKFGVSRTTASRWVRALNGNGIEGLRKRRAPGRPCRLTTDQFRQLAEVYHSGPRAAGFDTERWTTVRFAEAIWGRFQVRYDPDHAGRILHRLGLRERRKRHRRGPELVYIAPALTAPEEMVVPERTATVA